MNNDIMRQAGFSREVERVENGLCPTCKQPVTAKGFRDPLSAREFKISGMCQKCQDEVFGAD